MSIKQITPHNLIISGLSFHYFVSNEDLDEVYSNTVNHLIIAGTIR